MLSNAKLGAFVPTTDGERAKAFYVGILGLRFVSDDPFALVVDSNAVTVRVTKVRDFVPQQFTVLGWEVDGIERIAKELSARGVVFERYSFLEQDELGIWTAPSVDNASGNAKVAWFKDPDGNVLSLSEYVAV